MARDESEPLESDVDFAGVQARQQGASVAAQKAFPLPLLGFVSTLNGQGGGITLGAGSLPTGVGATFSNGAGTISLNLTGIDPIATKKSNLAAAVAPAITDDSASDYAVGSVWIDTTADDAYVCLDSSAGAAVWKKTTP